jgi:hypothetical protein
VVQHDQVAFGPFAGAGQGWIQCVGCFGGHAHQPIGPCHAPGTRMPGGAGLGRTVGTDRGDRVGGTSPAVGQDGGAGIAWLAGGEVVAVGELGVAGGGQAEADQGSLSRVLCE